MALTELTGTDKQTRWAREIRDEVIAEIQVAINAYSTPPDDRPDLRELWEGIAAALTKYRAAAIQEHTDAAWWIENREAATTGIVVRAAKASGAPSIAAIQNKIIGGR